MTKQELPQEWLDLAKNHGFDLDQLPDELTDEQLEAVVAGKDNATAGLVTGIVGTSLGGIALMRTSPRFGGYYY